MSYAAGKEVALILRTLPSGQHCSVRMARDRCKELGLLDTYDDMHETLLELGSPQAICYVHAYPRGRRIKRDRTLRIHWKVATPDGPKRRSVTVYLGSKVTLLDVAELLHFVKIDWDRANGPDGTSHPRSWWEELYQSGDIRSHRAATAPSARVASSRHPVPALGLAI